MVGGFMGVTGVMVGPTTGPPTVQSRQERTTPTTILSLHTTMSYRYGHRQGGGKGGLAYPLPGTMKTIVFSTNAHSRSASVVFCVDPGPLRWCCCEARKRMMFPRQMIIDLSSRQINDFLPIWSSLMFIAFMSYETWIK